jgi:outer membrane receptor protein involved in Fe transport
MEGFGFVLWDTVPISADEIKQIEVVRGPASAVWGANAVTGIVNIITKPPREAQGTTVTLNGGLFDRECDRCSRSGAGYDYGGGVVVARAPNDRWSYNISGGYFGSDPFSRPTGRIPRVVDPRMSPSDPGYPQYIGGALYPADSATGINAFENHGTSQPKFDVRIDNDLTSGGQLSIQGGYAGTDGIIHTGTGPFEIQSGSYLAYGRAGYTRGGLKAAVYANFVDAQGPNLLNLDPDTLQPIQLSTNTQTYDAEIGYTRVVGGRHILSMGGNARRNNFDSSTVPNAKDLNQFGGYFQDEVFFDKFRIALGARVDEFGNLDDPTFSPRVSLMFKPTRDHAIRASFNRAFLAPGVLANYGEGSISNPVPIDLRGLTPFLPPALRPYVEEPFFLTVESAGSEIVSPPYNLKEKRLDAFEIAYTGTFGKRTTFGVALYQNDGKDNINFVPLLPTPQFPEGLPGLTYYTPANPARGITVRGQPIVLPPALMAILGALPPPIGPIRLPETVFSYLNLSGTRDRGVEVSLDHVFSSNLTGSINYSWQDDPTLLDPAPGEIPYPKNDLELPPTDRFNAGLSWNSKRFLGAAQASFVDDALWTDVLGSPFHGFTDSYTLVNASFGVRWSDGRVTTSLKCVNLLNEDAQQHVFGDILKRSLHVELKLRY